MSIQIVMDTGDFERLADTYMDWARYADDTTNEKGTHPGWRQQVTEGRFEVNGATDELPSLHWKRAYWLGTGYVAVILAKSFLSNRGFDCQVIWDLAENPDPSWVVLTDYQAEGTDGMIPFAL